MRQWLEDVETRHGIDKLTLRSRQVVLISFAVLLVLVIYRGFLLQDDEFNWRPVVAFVLPLVLFLPSIIGKRARGHAWLAFVSLLYFTQGVMLVTLPGQGLRGVVEAVVALVLFAGCMGYARFRSRQLRQ
ncbi:DUF2069 domain-containing protein [Halomonas sp. FeN2]|uniref:DUF2069 domain-containing protein n=1 Tax=Vreelandella neptunia TaxID=115551 RepID=A0ABZ0YUJ4_9GAMM|nr:MULTISPECIES: DUF2069 domain-containing protein [Halomonas]TDV94778.1 putative membrane protein [Halomonas alkaliantarctica]MBF57130.1 hypothetical protein [Halomonas sp.]MDN3561942.1 DUF2069 domain-containing protein [Halomonas neptunia]UBR50072.1 DUF2069 domain-containing protein [Halomonas sp. FeN2]WQH14891.1 DUF2069 domain-containing protein [Halomonas neptunia]|tara:strand:- start:1639 stop:2028 length:390 start_codon:yes stop_codon:yes gene_type:complete